MQTGAGAQLIVCPSGAGPQLGESHGWTTRTLRPALCQLTRMVRTKGALAEDDRLDAAAKRQTLGSIHLGAGGRGRRTGPGGHFFVDAEMMLDGCDELGIKRRDTSCCFPLSGWLGLRL